MREKEMEGGVGCRQADRCQVARTGKRRACMGGLPVLYYAEATDIHEASCGLTVAELLVESFIPELSPKHTPAHKTLASAPLIRHSRHSPLYKLL